MSGDLKITAAEQASFDRHAQDYAWLRDNDAEPMPLSRDQVREHYVKGMRAARHDEIWGFEWRNRYLAAKVKYLEGKLAEKPPQEREAG